MTLHEPDLGDRPVLVLGQSKAIVASGGTISDVLPALAARIYVAAPS